MASFFDPTYDPRQDSGSSGVEVSDLNPEKLYDTDLRRVDEDARKSAKAAGKYKQRAGIAEPTIRGKTPRGIASIAGTELPSLGDRIGRGGSVNYAEKPQPFGGMPY
jgi:hypothetical protein